MDLKIPLPKTPDGTIQSPHALKSRERADFNLGSCRALTQTTTIEPAAVPTWLMSWGVLPAPAAVKSGVTSVKEV